MKQLYLLLVLTFVSFNINAQSSQSNDPTDTANYPHWIEMMQDQNINFYQTQRAFEMYWANRKPAKGTGYKVFKRWEYFWQSRVDASGEFPAPDQNIIAFQQFYGTKGPNTSTGGNWTELGPIALPYNGTGQPNGLGRVNCIAFHPTNANIIYAGAPSGGLWRTTNGGTSWTILTDDLPSLGISSILIDPTNTNTIYIGTGDRDGGDAPGIGVYKSIDGGANWTVMNNGMGNRTVGMMIMHPTNSSLILAATSNGIYKTTNGGTTWTQVSSNNSHYRDIAFKPGDPTTVYAVYNNAFYKSTNTGDTWTQITSGLPTSGRFVIGVSAANTAYVYVVVGNNSGFVGAYRSTNSGTSFTTMSTTPNILGYEADGSDNSSQAFYDLCIAVDPTNANTLYVGGINIWKSTNGGTSWTINAHWVGDNSPAIHADQHWLGFSPINSRLYNGNDGGIYYTANGGSSWIDVSSGLAIAQIYKLGQSASSKNLVINGYQDNGTGIYRPSGWSTEIGGDGMECLIDPTDTNYIYGSLYYGDIRRSTNSGTNFYQIAENGLNGLTESGGWVTPYTLNVSNANIMYLGYKNVWKATNVKASSTGSITWTQISTFGTTSNLTDIENCAADNNILYVSRGTTLFRSDNVNAATPTWTTLTAAATITDIETHPTNSSIVYITAGTNIYKSTNKGASWTSIKANLPNTNINALVYDKNSNEGIYVGTDIGVFYKDASMTNWVAFSTNLPVAAEITELEIFYATNPTQSVIRAATYGRGMWSSDLYSSPTAPPVTDFNVSNTTPCQGQYVTFTDLTSNTPTTWQWTFSPATVLYSSGSSATSQNPVVAFTAAGNYTVKLYAANAYGNDTVIKTNYISVGSPVTAPANENFESFTTGNPGTFANGWTFSNTGAFNWRVNSGATPSAGTGPNFDHTTGTSTGKYLYTEASNPAVQGEVANLISPCIYIPGSANYQLSFWYHMYGAAITGLHVDVFHNGSWVNDIYTINGQQQTSNNSSWLFATVPMSTYSGSTVQVRFRVIMGTTYEGDVAIDDIAIGIPGVPVVNFSASTLVTYTGTQVNFADATLNTPSSWSWSFSPSTVTYVNSTSASSQNPSVVFNSAGNYSVTLIASNSNGSDTLTKPNYISVSSGYSLPFNENFQTFTVGTPGSLSNGWTTVVNGNFPWTVNSGGTPSLLTGPLNDHTLGTSSGIYMFTEASNGGTGNETQLISPAINLTSVSNAELKFWYHMHGAGVSALYVDIYTNTWTNIYTLTGQQQVNQTDPWLQASVNLLSYVGNTVKIRFRVISNGDYRNDISVDDILVQQVVPPVNDNPCGAPTLSIGSTCSYTTYNNLNSTATSSVPNPPCGGYAGEDVWFKFVAPASGLVNIDAEQSTGSFADGAMAIYKGSCTGLTYINCVDDYNGNGNMPYIALTGLTPGDTIFVRFWKFQGNGTGNFQLCVYEPPYITISPNTKNVTSALGSTTFQVLSNQSWTASDNAGWMVLSPTSGTGSATITANYSANAGSPRTAVISVTNGLGITSTATLTQLSSVVAGFTISTPYLCRNTATTFTNTSTNAASQQWYVDGVSAGTSTNLTYTFTTAGTHTVKLVITNGSISDSTFKALYVSIPPMANAGNDTTLCANGSINLIGAVSMGIEACSTGCALPTYCNSASNNDNDEYISKVEIAGSINSSGNQGAGYQNFTSSLFTVLTIDSSAYIYITGYIPGTNPYNEYVDVYIDWNRNGLFDEPSISLGNASFYGAYIFTGIVTVPSTASLGKTMMRVILKYGQSINSGCENAYAYGETEDYMIEIVGVGQNSYSWSGPSSYTASTRTANVTNVSTANGGTYALTVTDDFGCSSVDTKIATVIATPNVSFSTLPNKCINASAFTLTQGSPSGGTYWGTGVSGGSFNPASAGVGTHTLYYRYTNSNGCGDTAMQTINVYALPTVTITTPSPLCNNGGVVQLIGGSPSGGTYTGTGVSGGSFNPIIAGTGTKSITYSYTDANGCSNSAIGQIVVNAAPTVSMSALGNKCINGGTSLLTGGTPSGGTYYGPGVNSGIFNPAVAGLGSHTLSYIYTNANSCSDTATNTINVVAAPNASLSSFASVCDQSPAFTLTGGSPTGGSYFGTSVSGGQFNPSVGAGTYTIGYIASNANNCYDTAYNTITVNPLPTVNIVGLPGQICKNEGSISLAGSPIGGTFSGNGVSTGQFNPVAAGVGTHSITYTYTNSNNCTKVKTESIEVLSVPLVNAGTDSQVNYSLSKQLSGTVSGSGTYTTIWKPSSMVVTPTSLTTQTVALTASQQFTLVATDQNTGCNDSDDVNITVIGGPLSVNITSTATTLCQGDSLTLTGLAGGGTGTYTYQWKHLGQTISNNSVFSFIPTSSGYYKMTISDGNNTIHDSVFITINPLPNVSFGGLVALCDGSPAINLTGAVPSGGTYTGVGVFNGFFVPTAAGIGNHTITYTYTNSNGCTNTATSVQTVNAKPTVTLTSFNPVCDQAQPFALTGGSPSGGVYMGQGISGNVFNPSAAGIGTHQVKYVYTNTNSCSDTAFANLTVQSSPVANAGTDQTVNFNSTANLTASATGGSNNFSYTWAPTLLVQNPGSQITTTQSLTYTTIFSVLVTDVQNGCSDYDSVTIFVSGGQLTGNLTATNTNICIGQSVQLLALGSGGTGNYSYAWNSIPTGFSSSVYNPMVTPNQTTTYIVTITSGAIQWTDSITINASPVPQIFLGNDTLICSGGIYTLNAGQGFNSYAWSNNATTPSITLNLSMMPAGVYPYAVTVTNAGNCSDSDTIIIFKDSKPYVNLGPDDSICSVNDSRIIDAGYGFNSYLWSTGDSTQIILVDGSLGIGTHPVWVVVSSNLGCENTDTMMLKVVVCGGISEYSENYKITIYPNPSQGRYTIDLEALEPEKVNLNIYTMDGRIIRNEVLEISTGRNTFEIDIINHPAGIYIINLNNSKLNRYERLIKN